MTGAQKVFIEGTMDRIKKEMLKNTLNMPEHWTGVELRWFIVETVKEDLLWGAMDFRSREKAYKKDKKKIGHKNLT